MPACLPALSCASDVLCCSAFCPGRVAISMACRLRFCRKLDVGDDGSTVGSTSLGGPMEQLDLDAMLRWEEEKC